MSKRSPIPYIIIIAPILLCAALMVYPSYDDWSTLSSPNYDSQWQKFFLPYGSVWRPFDALLGYIVAPFPQFFPSLNHVLIVLAHVLGATLVYAISVRLRMSDVAQFCSAVFFLVSPCMLGTMLSCDAFNQAYSLFFGLLSVYCYLSMRGKRRYATWVICVLLAALSKDNGIAWSIVPPILAFSFHETDRRTLLRHFAFGMAIAILYGCIRLSLPKTYIYNPDYNTFLLSKKIKEIATWIGYTWVAADYVSLLHTKSRNLWLFGGTLLMSLPMLWMLFAKCHKIYSERQFYGIAACILITMSPHLLISLSVMNTYAGLGMAALLVGFCTDRVAKKNPKAFKTAFLLYLIASFITDIHHTYKAIQTSNVGKQMARSIIKETEKPADNVFCVVIDDDDRKFSSFCVLPQDAFGAKAAAVVHENKYVWPQHIDEKIMPRDSANYATEMARKALKSGKYDCAWIINKQQTSVIKKP